MREISKDLHGESTSNNKSTPQGISGNTWMEAFDVIAKEHDYRWHEVTRINVYTFDHMCKFLSRKIKKKQLAQKKK